MTYITNACRHISKYLRNPTSFVRLCVVLLINFVILGITSVHAQQEVNGYWRVKLTRASSSMVDPLTCSGWDIPMTTFGMDIKWSISYDGSRLKIRQITESHALPQMQDMMGVGPADINLDINDDEQMYDMGPRRLQFISAFFEGRPYHTPVVYRCRYDLTFSKDGESANGSWESELRSEDSYQMSQEPSSTGYGTISLSRLSSKKPDAKQRGLHIEGD